MEKMRVLIIDDDKDTAQLFSVILDLVGFECEIVHSAKQALARLAATQPDLILLDLRLGLEISGEDILYQIRSNPRHDQARVIVITAYPSMAEPITALADLILLKPVDVDQLRSLTSRLMLSGDRDKRYYFRDPVTDLFNREFFMTRLEHAFERFHRRPDFLFSLLAFEFRVEPIEELDASADDLEHLLRQAADRLRKCYRPTDTIARLEGEVFITLHEDLKRSDDLQVLVNRLRECFTETFTVEGRPYHLLLSIGAVLNSAQLSQPGEMLEQALEFMKEARQRGEEIIFPVN